MIKKFRKKPIVIEAIQWDGNNHDEIFKWSSQVYWFNSDYLEVDTKEGRIKASINDWIIKGIKGEFYPCKPDIFEKTYEDISEEGENC